MHKFKAHLNIIIKNVVCATHVFIHFDMGFVPFGVFSASVRWTENEFEFPTYFAFQYMTFPNISYTFLVEDSTKINFMDMNGTCRKFGAIYPAEFLHVRNLIFLSSGT